RKWFVEAIASAQRGIEIGRRLGNDETGQDFVNNGLLHLGHIMRTAGNYSDALRAFDQVIEFYQHSKKQAYLYGATKGRLLALMAQGNYPAARVELERVLALYEQFRENILEESNRNSFFDQEQGTYDIATDFAYSMLNDPEQAYIYAELSRARSLLDEVTGVSLSVEGPQHPELLIQAKVRPGGSEFLRREMPDQVQLIEYAVLNDKLIVWLISRDCFASQAINLSTNGLKGVINNYLTLMRQKPGKTDQRWREQAAELYDFLIRPIAHLLDGRKHLCVAPDKILTRLPFGTLINRNSGRMLIEDYLVSYAPSASVFLELTAKAKLKASVTQERLLAVGNPSFDRTVFRDLDSVPATLVGAARIARFYVHPRLLVEKQATKTAVLHEMQKADVVHLAMHYVPDPWSPMYSRLPLAAEDAALDDGVLQLHELYRLRLERPRLVVLAACQTNGESYYDGEGAIGVSRLFEAVGVPLVIASLWSVDSEATSELMVTFHRFRKRAGQPTIEALRRAQLELFNRADEYRHPYYWAAFVAVGGYGNY
ncbi:MAG: CHAT domain-containing protein, partial [Blastocatellia bacterium]